MRIQSVAIRWKLREIMAREKVTNRELAAKIGMHENSVSKLKSQDTLPRIGGETLNEICRALSCTPYELIEYSPDDES